MGKTKGGFLYIFSLALARHPDPAGGKNAGQRERKIKT